jgi:hypothetical protein
MSNFNQILIFKTNIQTEQDKQCVQHALNTHDQIQRWTIDLYDVDCVLRVESEAIIPEQIIAVIEHHGFECSELE